MRISLSLWFGLITALAWLGSGRSNGQTQTPNLRPSLVTVAKEEPKGDIVADVEKMLQAGTGHEVIEAFIKNWSVRYQIGAEQILRLHDIGAPTDVLTALIRRSAELEAKAAVPTPSPVITTPSLVTTNPPAIGEGTNTAPLVVYPYPYYPLYTYSSLYSPPLFYRYPYWSSPYSFSFYSGWGGYRPYYWGSYWGYRPWSGRSYYYPGYDRWGRYPGFQGRGPGWGGRPGWGGGPRGGWHGHR